MQHFSFALTLTKFLLDCPSWCHNQFSFVADLSRLFGVDCCEIKLFRDSSILFTLSDLLGVLTLGLFLLSVIFLTSFAMGLFLFLTHLDIHDRLSLAAF